MVGYLIRSTSKGVRVADSGGDQGKMRAESDFEKIGDYCGSLMEEAQLHNEQNITFSVDGKREFD